MLKLEIYKIIIPRMKIRNIKSVIPIILALLLGPQLFGQVKLNDALIKDSTSISLKEAEDIFLKKNLQLLSLKYNVSATEALILQAKLWPNPNLNIAQGLYNSQTKKWLQTDAVNGEEAGQISQLIQLAGKISKQVHIAKVNYKLSEDNLYATLLSLKLALRTSFFNIYYLRETEKVYNQEIGSLKTIVAAYKQQEGKGYVAEADVVRVQAQLYSLMNEYQTLIDSLNDQESQLRLLLQLQPTTYIKPVVDTQKVQAINPLSVTLQLLIDSANINRGDMRIAKDNLELSQANYSLQKAIAVPDINAALGYDRQGSYIPNFNSIGIAIDIPIFNRNQGNIRYSRIMVDYNKTQLDLTHKTLEEQVTRGFQKAIDADKLYKEIDPSFAGRFNDLAKSMAENYMKRNVNLLNFLNFYDSYKQNIVQLNTILFNRVNALENLNYLTGTSFFNN